MSTPADRWIDQRVDDALDRAFEQIVKYADDGYCTRQDVQHRLAVTVGEDVVELWDQFCEEWDE